MQPIDLYQPPADDQWTGGYLYNRQLGHYQPWRLQVRDSSVLRDELGQADGSSLKVLDSLYLYSEQLMGWSPQEPVFWLIHHLQSCEPQLGEMERQKVFRQEQYHLAKAHGLLATSRFMAETLLTMGFAEAGTLPVGWVRPGVRLESLQAYREQRRHSCFADSGPKPTQVRILSVGHCIPRKGYLEGLPVMSQLLQQLGAMQWQWDIIGSVNDNPVYVRRLQASIHDQGWAERVQFLGARPPDQVWQHMSRADLLFFPSLFETFGMVVLEALAIGLPVLAPAIGELPYLAVDEPLLHLYDPAAPIKALAQWSAGSLHGRGQPHHTGASHWLRDWSAVAAEASQWLLQQA